MLASVEKRSHLGRNVVRRAGTEPVRQAGSHERAENAIVEDDHNRHVCFSAYATTGTLDGAVEGRIQVGVGVPPLPPETAGIEGPQGLNT
jgi:hypothetical protein